MTLKIQAPEGGIATPFRLLMDRRSELMKVEGRLDELAACMNRLGTSEYEECGASVRDARLRVAEAIEKVNDAIKYEKMARGVE